MLKPENLLESHFEPSKSWIILHVEPEKSWVFPSCEIWTTPEKNFEKKEIWLELRTFQALHCAPPKQSHFSP